MKLAILFVFKGFPNVSLTEAQVGALENLEIFGFDKTHSLSVEPFFMDLRGQIQCRIVQGTPDSWTLDGVAQRIKEILTDHTTELTILNMDELPGNGIISDKGQHGQRMIAEMFKAMVSYQN